MGSNCVASTSIGCLFCCKGCNAEKVRNAFTFVPPRPSYSVEPDPEDKSKGRLIYQMEALRGSSLYRQAAECSEVHWVTTRKGNRIPMVWVRQTSQASRHDAKDDQLEANASAAQPPLVLLHCHGNATDIGVMMGPYYELAKVLGIEVVGVEYSGYGASEGGKPSTGNTYADAEAAYEQLVASGVSPNRIVAYGQSVGSGPACSLASKLPLCGIILHSPLLSGIKVLDPQPDSCCRPSCVWKCFDFYPNDRRAKSLLCPAFVMHGQRDDIIPFYHGYRLHQACPKERRWPAYFPQRAGHNDLVETDMRSYFGELSNFLHDLRKAARGEKVEPPAHRPRQVSMRPSASSSVPAAPSAAKAAAEGSCDKASAADNGDEVKVDPTALAPGCDQAGNNVDVDGHNDAGQQALKRSSRQETQEAAMAAAGEFAGAAKEPLSGPQDGRYEQFRAGRFQVPGPTTSSDSPSASKPTDGQAREVVLETV